MGIHYLFDIPFRATESTLVVDVASGVGAGVIASLAANPTDVLKIRLQAQKQSYTHESKNIFTLFTRIYKQE
eukprot:Pgem_evm1s9238